LGDWISAAARFRVRLRESRVAILVGLSGLRSAWRETVFLLSEPVRCNERWESGTCRVVERFDAKDACQEESVIGRLMVLTS
jgi:hypothetical protein